MGNDITSPAGSDECSRCGVRGLARDAGQGGRKRKGQFFFIEESWFIKLLVFRCSECDGIVCGGCCRTESAQSEDGETMMECYCPTCGQVLGAYLLQNRQHIQLVQDMQTQIDRMSMRSIKANFRDPYSEIKQVFLIQNGCPLEEVAAVMASGNYGTLMNMVESGYVKMGVDSMDNVKSGHLSHAVFLDTYGDDQYCEVIYLPPSYLVKTIHNGDV